MDLAQAEAIASVRRKHMNRIREVKVRIRRMEKLMNTISGLESALQLIISEIPSLESFILVLGASPIRPQNVYELCFSRGIPVPRDASDFAKTKAAEGLSRKVFYAILISRFTCNYFLLLLLFLNWGFNTSYFCFNRLFERW